jgi:hypothetical protein
VIPLREVLRAILGVVLWPVVATYMLLTDLVWPAVRPLIDAFSRLPLFERLRRWLLTLPPYPALLLFAVPLAVLEPLKMAAVYWTALGHLVSGGGGLLVLHAIGLLSTERLFAVLKPTLLRIGWFAAVWSRIAAVRDRLIAWTRSTAAWVHTRRLGLAVQALGARFVGWLRPKAGPDRWSGPGR